MSEKKDNEVLSNAEKSLMGKQAFLQNLSGKTEPIILHGDKGETRVELPIVQQPVAQTEPTLEVKKEEPVIEKKPEETKAEPQAEEKPKKKVVKVKTPLGEKTITSGVDEPIKIENAEKLIEFAKENGIEVDSLDKFADIFKEYKEIKNKYSETDKKYKDIQEKYESQARFLNDMRPDVKAILVEYIKEINGEGGSVKNIIKTLGSSNLDYNKDVTSYGDLQLVNEFSKKKIEKEVWDELSDEDKEEKIEFAKEKYLVNQKKIVDADIKYKDERQSKQKKIAMSIDESLIELKQKLSKEGIDLTDDKLDELRVQMSGGFVRDLYNDDGTFKKEAAEKIVYGRYGKEFINSYESAFAQMEQTIQKETNKAVSETTENMIKNGSQTAPAESAMIEKEKVEQKSELQKKAEQAVQNAGKNKKYF